MTTYPNGAVEMTLTETKSWAGPGKRFCTICGRELDWKVSSDGFSAETGEKVLLYVPRKCPIQDCTHFHHAWRSDGWFSATMTCTKCGMKTGKPYSIDGL